MNERRDTSPAGYLTYCTPPPRNSPQLRNIIALDPAFCQSRDESVHSLLRASRETQVELCSQERKPHGIDADGLNSAECKMSYLFISSYARESIFPGESAGVPSTSVFSIFNFSFELVQVWKLIKIRRSSDFCEIKFTCLSPVSISSKAIAKSIIIRLRGHCNHEYVSAFSLSLSPPIGRPSMRFSGST